MKKVLLISALVMTIVASMVSGTLAVYQTTITDIADITKDSVFAKRFVLEQFGETDHFLGSLKIAPSDNKVLSFSVKNYGDLVVDPEDISEVDMKFQVKVTLGLAVAPVGDVVVTDAIAPLTVKVYEVNAAGVETLMTPDGTFGAAGTGTVTYAGSSILTAGSASEKLFKVVVEWPEDTIGVKDSDFAGPKFGTSLSVSVTGTQN